jgi:hypothetical protein
VSRNDAIPSNDRHLEAAVPDISSKKSILDVLLFIFLAMITEPVFA